ncbi:MAG: dipicolinate synthase subunit B [Clostridia bacterium]|nr:dipicolinate synthase subunit B [Clostridia bacterium]
MIGYAFCGSFCTLSRSIARLEDIVRGGADVVPFVSERVFLTDTRFGKSRDFIEKIEKICGRSVVRTVEDAEPYGPTRLDYLVISPCTGNTLAKIANGITDGTVTMAAKAHLRSDGRLLIALATNDASSQNLKNIATLLQRKGVYFVPMLQDDPINKPHSLVADFDLIPTAIDEMLKGRQMRPLFK